MPSHSRRDPRLPNLIATELLNKKQTLAEKIEQTRKKLGMKQKQTYWEKYGHNAVSYAEKSDPEKGQ